MAVLSLRVIHDPLDHSLDGYSCIMGKVGLFGLSNVTFFLVFHSILLMDIANEELFSGLKVSFPQSFSVFFYLFERVLNNE